MSASTAAGSATNESSSAESSASIVNAIAGVTVRPSASVKQRNVESDASFGPAVMNEMSAATPSWNRVSSASSRARHAETAACTSASMPHSLTMRMFVSASVSVSSRRSRCRMSSFCDAKMCLKPRLFATAITAITAAAHSPAAPTSAKMSARQSAACSSGSHIWSLCAAIHTMLSTSADMRLTISPTDAPVAARSARIALR